MMKKIPNHDEGGVGIDDAVRRDILAEYVYPGRPRTSISREERDQTTIKPELGISGGAEKII
jgi:hypothetical protein